MTTPLTVSLTDEQATFQFAGVTYTASVALIQEIVAKGELSGEPALARVFEQIEALMEMAKADTVVN